MRTIIKRLIVISIFVITNALALDINIKHTKNSDIVMVVGELTGTTFAHFGAKNNGKMSMVGKNLSKKEMIVLLHEILGGLNLGLIQGNGYFKVINRYKTTKHNPPLVESIEDGIGMINYMLKIDKRTSSDIIKAITPLMGDGSKINYQTGVGALLLTDDTENIRKILKIIKKIENNYKEKHMETVLINYADVEVIVSKLGSLNIKDVSIVADKQNKQVFLYGNKENALKLAQVIRDMDKVKRRIIIEVLIAEISETKNENTGVQVGLGSEYGVGISGWGGSDVTPIGSLLGSLASGNIPSVPEGASFGLGSNKNSKFKFGLLIQAIKKSGGSNILSTPLINTIDGVEAEFVVGKNVPFVTGVETGENPFQSIKREDVGLKLKVLPEILHNGEIRLSVEQEISSISGSTKLDDIITDKRYLKTKIMATDGDLIILGGLMDKSGGDNSKKIPFLGDIPYLGSLFRYDGTTDEKRKLLIFMKPRIITNENKDQIMREALSNQNLQYKQVLKVSDSNMYLGDEDEDD